MKLSRSAAEEAARQRVQLPFEHQGRVGGCTVVEWECGLCASQRPETRSATAPPPPPRSSSPSSIALQGAAYQTGDWRDYLPPEAGGRAGGGGAAAASAGGQAEQQLDGQGGRRLGHILYVRDSGSEHDSDEDPDDDLDI